MNEFPDTRFDYVITVCNRAKETCPIFRGATSILHWSFEDPAEAKGSEEEQLSIFRRVRDEIAEQVKMFVQKIATVSCNKSDRHAASARSTASLLFAGSAPWR